MASSSDVVKRVLRFKLQLTDTAESATVLKVLQKLKDLDITLDILAETGIGKTVNSLRRHEQAGEFARSLVKGWKKLLSKDCTSFREDEDVSENTSVQDKPDEGNCPNAEGLTTITDLNNNCLTAQTKNQDSSDEALFKTVNRKNYLDKQQGERKRKKKDNQEKGLENQIVFESDVLDRKNRDDETDDSFAPKKNDQPERESVDSNVLLGSKTSVEPCQTSRSGSGEKPKISFEIGRFVLEKESNKKPNPKKQLKETTLFESTDKYSQMVKLASVRDKAKKRKRKKASKESHSGLEDKRESENKGHNSKKAKIKHKEKESDSGNEEPSKSFESFLNYDVNVFKRKERHRVKKPSNKSKNVVKEETSKHSAMKPCKSPVTIVNAPPPKQMLQESVMDLMGMSLPAVLPECEKPTSVEYYDRKADKGSDSCDVLEEPAVFTGQRLNKKMHVYSGAKTVFLPTMMSLYQLCIRTLQNNINLLHDTGGVQFEILEPVLERCTPEQLLRIEECNPIYIGVTDHLWGKHCQRDFKDSKLQEYESWKEMYIRLSEERERKFQRLTQSIVSAQSKKPKVVKMAFIHTVAKPPRDVRIQQEIHGTAVQQPQQLKCSSGVKAEENKLRPTCNEPGRSTGSSSSGSTTQDSRKKTRVAPMMAKSLKAFKKQLGRR